MLPRDTPVTAMPPSEARKKGCELKCDGKYLATELLKPGVIQKVVAELGAGRAPEFAVGVYAGERAKRLFEKVGPRQGAWAYGLYETQRD
ncbi:hypothetical protein ACFXJ8_37330 [Nonomuraea sp. NPDC059194]|uniref:hypothetical protein n=1 Tax=Nonomuraea sp. NPDC059194 TaxID=3346764 RepID=UPI003698D267